LVSWEFDVGIWETWLRRSHVGSPQLHNKQKTKVFLGLLFICRHP
jgi:hypothetical protein